MSLQLPPSFSTTLDQAARAIRAGELSSQRVLEQCIENISRYDAKVRAWVMVDLEEARTQAMQRDAQQAAHAYLGPLHGVPIGVKDIFDVKGLITRAGVQQWSQRPATMDAPVVAALRAAGAVILGKTVTTAYAWLDPAPTTNPWDPARTPGGSSSGSAAAVACGMCLGALGSQTGGSLIRPASYCGIASLKPSYNRLSCQGVVPLAQSLDHPGILAPTVADLARLWVALTGMRELVSPAAHPVKLGQIRGEFTRRASAVAREATDRFAGALRQAGAEVTNLELPEQFESIPGQFRTILATEAASIHSQRFRELPEDYPPLMTALVEEGQGLSIGGYLAALDHQKHWKSRILECLKGVDALMMPSTPDIAPDRASTGDPSFNSPWSYLGLPVVTVPVAANFQGLPLGVQLVGAPLQEEALLKVALWCQQQLPTNVA